MQNNEPFSINESTSTSNDAVAFRERQMRLQDVEHTLKELRDIWRDQFEELVEILSIRVKSDTSVAPGNRHTVFTILSQIAEMKLRFAAFADEDVRNIIFENDLHVSSETVVDDAHSQISFPVDHVDKQELDTWIHKRIMNFKKTYIDIHAKHT